jgi:tellurite resistance protein TerC
VVLGFIGVKLVLEFFHLHISTAASLGVIALVLGVTTVASLARARREPRRRAHAGALRSKPEHGVE